MTPPSKRCGPLPAALLLALLFPPAHALPSIPGIVIENPDWAIIMTPEGYSDVAIDRRAGFVGREYLSGEWAAAIHYTGGADPEGPIWLREVWGFPCWTSNSNFTVSQPIEAFAANGDGFTRFDSIVANGDVEITMTYEMLDAGSGIAQGEAPASAASGGHSISGRYVFRHHYSVRNVSGETLSNVRFYQFLHGLNSGSSVYDDRNYGGTMAEYRFDNTQKGGSRSIQSITGEIFEHDDTVCMHAMQAPSAHECGYYGIQGIDSHELGKPGTGVHLSVEAGSLDGRDSFDPPEEGWVSGAMCFDFPNLAPGASHEISLLLSIVSESTGTGDFPEVRILDTHLDGSTLVIDFQEASGAAVDGFILHQSKQLPAPFPDGWPSPGLPYLIDVPSPGVNRFEIPVDTDLNPACFFIIAPVVQ